MNVLNEKPSPLKEMFRIFVKEKGPSYECLQSSPLEGPFNIFC
jgi:hypothetical protein